MKHITIDELKQMTDSEGLVLQGCGGDLDEWVNGINELLTQEGILLDGDTFQDVAAYLCNGLGYLVGNEWIIAKNGYDATNCIPNIR